MHNVDEKELKEQETRLKGKMAKVKNVFIVMSGKGGVGKSTIAVNLACAFSTLGKKTGIFDVDIHGPNTAKMLGIENRELISSQWGIEPILVTETLSAVTLACTGHDDSAPFIWRGPMKSAVIRQLLSDTNWGELDYLIIDAPPGTGDEHLSVCQMIPNVTGAIIVTTPQDVAVLDARKSIKFVQELKIPIAGIIENMSGFICPYCRKESDIFKKGGGEKAALDNSVTFLGRIPFDSDLVNAADEGKPFIFSRPDSESSRIFRRIVKKIQDFSIDEK